ncbi:hypothetical protein DL770_011770 [Monosporascus sp. CRB-9-2]|nr:hypothetical protein DL770_011770 [Monosporascus sp. CRB-9-2]
MQYQSTILITGGTSGLGVPCRATVPPAGARPRAVLTSSGTHDPAQKSGLPDAKCDTAEELARPQAAASLALRGRQRYATSKLANLLWAMRQYALNRRLRAHRDKEGRGKITATALDPGLMPGTGFMREAPAVERFVFATALPRLLWLLRLVYSSNVHTSRGSPASAASTTRA